MRHAVSSLSVCFAGVQGGQCIPEGVLLPHGGSMHRESTLLQGALPLPITPRLCCHNQTSSSSEHHEHPEHPCFRIQVQRPPEPVFVCCLCPRGWSRQASPRWVLQEGVWHCGQSVCGAGGRARCNGASVLTGAALGRHFVDQGLCAHGGCEGGRVGVDAHPSEGRVLVFSPRRRRGLRCWVGVPHERAPVEGGRALRARACRRLHQPEAPLQLQPRGRVSVP